MQTYADLMTVIASGKRPVVTFLPGVEDFETYAEEGMRARVVAARPHNDLVQVTFAFDEFEAHNRPYEKADYIAKGGGPNITAREAGYYLPQEDLYFEPSDPTDMLQFDSDSALELYAEFKTAQGANKAATTYTQWLEEQVLALRAAVR
jgi:hypothetical protein